MKSAALASPHHVHIPVMGTGFTIDTALKVARYGISSVMSVDDNLMERIREHYSPIYRKTYVPIPKYSEDSRAHRITEYLNFVGDIVEGQLEQLKASPFEKESEITKYFELIDDRSLLKEEYRRMLSVKEPREKARCEAALREKVAAGSIDVNILTKLDRENYKRGLKLPRTDSDAMAALRGFAKSRLNAAVVFSAGLNLHLFTYVSQFDDFYANADGLAKKRVILKVSDYRSALTQGKIFAKKGIWVWEYRIESGLNCGGHAFATDGLLLGPVLEEFKQKRKEFAEQLFTAYREAMLQKKNLRFEKPLPFRVTAQGGIGTSAENRFLMRAYELDGTGWATPFLLVPEATCVDAQTLARLLDATEESVYLSHASPMGIPIYNLKNSVSEEVRLRRIQEGVPGSPCLNGFMAFDTEFSNIPICTASRAYQKRKIEQLQAKNLPETEYAQAFEKIVEKACVCHDLGDVALAKYDLLDPRYDRVPAVCPGPNLVYFKKIVSLKEMFDHIYGRASVFAEGVQRPHFFINELRLYIRYLKDLVYRSLPAPTSKEIGTFAEFKENLLKGIEYYRELVSQFCEESEQSRARFMEDLSLLKEELEMHVRLELLTARVT